MGGGRQPGLTAEVDTIFARATGTGLAAVAIVRLSGPRALEIGRKLFRRRSGNEQAIWRSHRLVPGRLVDPETGKPLDEILAAFFAAARSPTGEELMEFHCHGSETVLRQVCKLMAKHGGRPAKPGEFSRRGFLNGKLTLDQAESIDELIRSRSEEGSLLEVANLSGALKTRISSLRAEVLELLASLEAGLDFPEDEVPITDQLAGRIDGLRVAISKLAASQERGRMLRDGLRVVLAGAPNVGKSSLLNALLKSERAIVSETPGTTRDTIEETLHFRGLAYLLVDTAGLRDARGSVEEQGIARARGELERADIVLLVLDLSRDVTLEEVALADWLRDSGKTVLVTGNKQDIGRIDLEEEVARLWTALKLPAIISAISALTGAGIKALLEALHELASSRLKGETGEPTVTAERHRDCLHRAGEALESFQRACDGGVPQDICLVELHEAARHLGAITGEIATDDILDVIFGKFCIGK